MKQFIGLLALVALSSPVAAAEVGARHTWGRTSTRITHGRSVTRSHTAGGYVESSHGGTHTGGYRRVEAGSFGSRTRESYNFNSHSTSGFSESSVFSR